MRKSLLVNQFGSARGLVAGSRPSCSKPTPAAGLQRRCAIMKNAFAMAAVANAIEQSDAVVITGNRLAVDDAGARPQADQCLDSQRKRIREIIAGGGCRASPVRSSCGRSCETRRV